MEFKSQVKEIIEWIYCIAIAIILALLFRYFIGTPTIVVHQSMYPTLEEKDRLWINRWVRTTKAELNYGDIITFEEPIYDITSKEYDLENPVAQYNTYTGWEKFKHDFLEIGKSSYIKRVIGKPGDYIEIKDGHVYRNGEQLVEDYLPAELETHLLGGLGYTGITVPENTLYVLGDNRANSVDSRKFGVIPYEKVESRVVARILPLNKFGKVK